MEIMSINAENMLASLASSIGRDQESWEGWLCLNFQVPEGHRGLHDWVSWVKNIVDSYLENADGRAFFCKDRNIYIMSKNVSRQSLEQSASLIFEMINDDEYSPYQYEIYNLGTEGSRFAKKFFERCHTLDFNQREYNHILEKSHEFTLTDLVEDISKTITYNSVYTPKVLLVEDDPMTRFMVRKAVKNQCELATAAQATKVFSLYTSYKPDIVFLDINLPDMNGYEVLNWIMNNDPGASVVMFSSNCDMDNIVNCMEQGAKGFIAKPFSKGKLLHYINNFAS